MASRSARPGRCPTGAGRPGTSRPALTRTEMLRQAKTAAVVQKEPRESAARSSTRAGGGCPGPRTGLARVGPPPADPKKVDFKRPGLTKAMQMRQKAAAEKIARDEEAKRKIEESKRRPRRTAAPVGGDARMGRERSQQPPPMTPRAARLQEAISRGHVSTRRGVVDAAAAEAAVDEAIARGHIVTDRRGAKPKRTRPDAASTSRRGGPAPPPSTSPIPGGAQQLARSMNAKIVQAVPLSDGPVDKIIIEPGVVSEDRNTIVCISRPGGGDASAVGGASIANRSVQAISETLDEQDAVEAATVQGKLEELQQARREFVIAVANVGNNAVGIADDAADEDDLSILDIDAMPDPFEEFVVPPRPPSTPPRRIVNVPDVSHQMFQLEYGPDHPDVMAAREFSRRLQASMDQRAAERRMQEGFARGGEQVVDDFRLDVPFEQDIMEGEYSFEEDEEGHMVPCPSRIKASMPPIPVRQKSACDAAQAPITIEELQRFMDLENYPPSPRTPAPPPGREHLNPDLWELEDPWYFEEQPPVECDLMRFDDSY